MWWPDEDHFFDEPMLLEKSPSVISDGISDLHKVVRKGTYGADLSRIIKAKDALKVAKFRDPEDITIILGNWNKTFYLRFVLNQYGKQDYPKNKYNIIVIDTLAEDYKMLGMASPKETVLRAKELFPDLNVKLYRINKDTGAAGIRWNTGLKRSTGSFTILNESDCVPVGKDFLKKYSAAYKIAITKGTPKVLMHIMCFDPEWWLWDQKLKEDAATSCNKIKTTRLSGERGFTYTPRFDVDFCCGYSTSAAKAIRGYDEKRDGYGGLEGNFYTRFGNMGGKQFFVEDVRVVRLPNKLVCPIELFRAKASSFGTIPCTQDDIANDENWGDPEELELLVG